MPESLKFIQKCLRFGIKFPFSSFLEQIFCVLIGFKYVYMNGCVTACSCISSIDSNQGFRKLSSVDTKHGFKKLSVDSNHGFNLR